MNTCALALLPSTQLTLLASLYSNSPPSSPNSRLPPSFSSSSSLSLFSSSSSHWSMISSTGPQFAVAKVSKHSHQECERRRRASGRNRVLGGGPFLPAPFCCISSAPSLLILLLHHLPLSFGLPASHAISPHRVTALIVLSSASFLLLSSFSLSSFTFFSLL